MHRCTMNIWWLQVCAHIFIMHIERSHTHTYTHTHLLVFGSRQANAHAVANSFWFFVAVVVMAAVCCRFEFEVHHTLLTRLLFYFRMSLRPVAWLHTAHTHPLTPLICLATLAKKLIYCQLECLICKVCGYGFWVFACCFCFCSGAIGPIAPAICVHNGPTWNATCALLLFCGAFGFFTHWIRFCSDFFCTWLTGDENVFGKC